MHNVTWCPKLALVTLIPLAPVVFIFTRFRELLEIFLRKVAKCDPYCARKWAMHDLLAFDRSFNTSQIRYFGFRSPKAETYEYIRFRLFIKWNETNFAPRKSFMQIDTKILCNSWTERNESLMYVFDTLLQWPFHSMLFVIF